MGAVSDVDCSEFKSSYSTGKFEITQRSPLRDCVCVCVCVRVRAFMYACKREKER